MMAWKCSIPLLFLLAAGSASGQSASLDKCQKEAANQSAKLVTAVTKAGANCLQKISGFVIKKNEPVAKAAKSCTSAFRKLENTDDPGKTVMAKMKAKIRKKCDPTSNASLAHTTSQVLDLALMPRGLEATGLNSWCSNFDGDGTINTVEEWIDCQINAGLCQARQQLVAEYPRILEWTTSIQADITALGMDTKFVDAANAVQELHDAVDRFANDSLTINCGPGVNSCGNGVKDGIDDCDGLDIGSDTCSSVGFQAGTLTCGADCHFDVSACTTGAFPATGQTTSYLATDDGDLENGAPALFVDNLDGTISDPRTGLMWEKKDRDGGIHDRGDSYEWPEINSIFLPALNTMPCFAGYCDWRIPNVHELGSLLNHSTTNPAAYPDFNTACPASCTIATCSCTDTAPYWSSTTYHLDTSQAWAVYFEHGRVVFDGKSSSRRLRAVRQAN